MQIVIDIPDEYYKKLVNPYQHNEKWCERLKRIVMNGTPLPKGHGAIVDMNQLNMWDVKQTPVIIPAEGWKNECDRNICTRNEYNGIGCDKCVCRESPSIYPNSAEEVWE